MLRFFIKKCIFLFICTFFLWFNTVAQNEPNIALLKDTITINIGANQTKINWGSVYQRDTVKTLICIKNNSPNLYILKRIKTGDGGCYTSINNEPINYQIILPNELFTFELEQWTNARKGKINKTICLYFLNSDFDPFEQCFDFYGYIIASDNQ